MHNFILRNSDMFEAFVHHVKNNIDGKNIVFQKPFKGGARAETPEIIYNQEQPDLTKAKLKKARDSSIK